MRERQREWRGGGAPIIIFKRSSKPRSVTDCSRENVGNCVNRRKHPKE